VTELLNLEPRDAGTDVVEPEIDFAQKWDSLHDRAKCQVTRPHVTIKCG